MYRYGTSPRLLPSLRGWGVNNTDVSLTRTFAVTEGVNIVFRADAVNVFNCKSFSDAELQKAFGGTYLPSNPNDLAQLVRAGMTTNATFGTLDLRSVGISPRYLQFALRVTF